LLTKVEVRNAAGDLLTLVLQDVSGGYSLRSVDGLDPVKATIVSSSYATRDGVEHETARREARNLTFKIGFEPDWILQDASALRRNLYRWFMTKQWNEFRFYEDDGLVVSIAGWTEDNKAPRFTSDPDATISVICDLPDFVGLTNEHVTGNSTSSSAESILNYAGSQETGFLFNLLVNRNVTGFSLYQRGADGVQYQLDFSADLIAGDVVAISTVPGNKYATLTRSGVTTSLLYGISPASPWLVLTPGANHIRLQINGAPVPYTIDYTDKYGGL
jgi:hypothetical protein